MIAGAVLLLGVADADEIIETEELDTISDIIADFFDVSEEESLRILSQGKQSLENSTGLFEAGELLNKTFERPDKIEFLKCVWEVGYSDGELHYLEQHTIKKIANILNLERADLVTAKIEVRDWFSKED